jgi:tetratricopeptide (TPR) repeat protein
VSKITELRRQATEAVRARRWERAVQLYNRVCELDSSNASYRNELGDVFLKMSDVRQAVEAFVAAARLYRGVGLTNNAVAVHKKILRHQPNHLDSLWELGEIRLAQGLEAEASSAYLDFLSRSELVPDAARESYLERCRLLLERMAGDGELLSALEAIFESWQEPLDHARALVGKALLAREAGEDELSEKYLEKARAHCADLEILPEWIRMHGGLPSTSGPVPSSPEPGAVELEGEPPAAEIPPPPGSGPHPWTAPEAEEIERIPEYEIPEEDLDLGFDLPSADLGEATAESEDSSARGDEPASGRTDANFDLLEQILADGDVDLRADEERQVEAIAQEMQGRLAGDVDPEDHAGQYELGLVYLDMGLYEQAVQVFERAAAGEEQRLRALEMKGTSLLRLGRTDEAMLVFEQGAALEGRPQRQYLGVRYGIGACHEARGEAAEALQHFRWVVEVDASFLDVAERVQSLEELCRD